MRSHAEMRQEAERVLADAARGTSLLYANGTLPALAADVIDLLDELERAPTSQAKAVDLPGSWRELLAMIAAIVTIVPALLLGKYFGWELGLAYWLTAGVAYSVRTRRRELRDDDSRWWALFFIIIAVTYGPFLLAFELLQASRLGKFALQHDS